MKKCSEYHKYFNPDVFVPDFYIDYSLDDIYGYQFIQQAKEILTFLLFFLLIKVTFIIILKLILLIILTR